VSTGKTAVISGGAGGLGQALAARLHSEGWKTAIIDLPGAQLYRAAELLGAQTSPYACDLTDEAQVAEVCTRILADHPSIDMVIYNAGITQIGPFSDVRLAVHRRVFEVNYFGAVQLASAFIAPLRRSRGVHLAISSVAGFTPLYHRAVYSASKHALEGFFKTLRVEEKPFGVDVLIAAPSFVATNIGRPETQEGGIARPGAAADGIDYMQPDEAARVILEGVRRKHPMIAVGRVARAAWLINRLSPRLYVRLMERSIKKPKRGSH
jgi:NAD(P)-dependent dehydrogenase (short-subunit alcohol dehydrogenase family)